jgi:hypothetical protein
MDHRQNKEREALAAIKEAMEKKQTVLCWYVLNDHTVKAELTVLNFHPNKDEIVFKPMPGSLPYLKQMISGSGKMNFFLPCQSCTFSSELKSLDENGKLVTSLPEVFRFNDRRSGHRVDLEMTIWADFEINGKKYHKKCFDLGAGGLSIVFSNLEHFRGRINQSLDSIELTVGKNKIETKCQIVNILKLTPYKLDNCPYGGSRVSFKFLKLKEKDKETLEGIVMSHLGLIKDLHSH